MPDNRPSWTESLGAIVAVLSLLANVVLGYTTYTASNRAAESQRQLAEIDKSIKGYELLKLDREASVLLETRFLVLSGMALFSIDEGGFTSGDDTIPVQKNSVLTSLAAFQEELSAGGKPIEHDEYGRTGSHALVVFRITNLGAQPAEKMVLQARTRTFSREGELASPLWELDPSQWQSVEFSLPALKPNESVVVPLGHVLGTDTYYGEFILPQKLTCWNPVKKQTAVIDTGRIVKSDQWLTAGLNISVAQ